MLARLFSCVRDGEMTAFSRRALIAAGAVGAGAMAARAAMPQARRGAAFSLAYAPHEGSFASKGGLLDQIAYAADQGFRAWEDNEARKRPVAEQAAMAQALSRRGMKMGVFVASMPRWAQSRPLLGANDDGERLAFLEDVRTSVEVAKRINATHATVVTGFMDQKVPPDIQTGRIIDLMRRAGDIVAPHGLVLVMEPLNTHTNHPGIFMRTIAQGYAVARGVDNPSVKVLADLYHEQIQSGNILPTLDACWGEIGYIQFGDNPGRNEPGTGEMNYRNIVRWLRARNYAGVIGMEHGNSVGGAPGEDRLTAAYREIDNV
jgi:hydroxypyruvate isomerase